MMTPHMMASPYAPLNVDETMTMSRLMTEFNPDNVPANKVVHTDTILGKSLTYGGLREQSAKCAWALQKKLGVKPNDNILLMIPNSTDFVLLVHSVWWAGASISPLNPLATSHEIVHALSLVKPTQIATEPSRLKDIQEAMTELGVDIPVFTVLFRTQKLPLFPDDLIGQSDVETLRPYNLTGTGRSSKTVVAAICFSSGTTGKFKGVQLSHWNLIQNTLQMRVSVPSLVNSSSREVVFLPYYHIYGMAFVINMGMWLGNFTCALSPFGLEMFCQKMAEYKANCAHIVPPVAALLAQSETARKYDLSNLKTIIVSAAPMKKQLQLILKARFGKDTKVMQAYGMTECSPAVMHQHETGEEAHVGTVGKLIANTRARLVDPATGRDVEAGSNGEGELWVQGPQVMMGYIGNEKATRESFSEDGQWYRTGDIMRVDENNNYWITDRLKELIKYKGLQVAPSELEDLLLLHPHVVDAAVTSIYDDEQATELPVAYVSLKPELARLETGPKQMILDDVRIWLDSKVAHYKKLRGGIFHLQQLPKTNTGKILRRELPVKRQEARKGKL